MPTTDTAVVVAASFTTVDLLTIGVTALGVGVGVGPLSGRHELPQTANLTLSSLR